MTKDLVTIDNPDSARGQFLVYEVEDSSLIAWVAWTENRS